MPKYMAKFRYTPDGVKGLLKEGGTKRRQATEELIKSLGGKLEAYYFTFGEEDGFALVDLPDNINAAAASLVVSATGAAVTSITVILTAEELDLVSKRSATYRPPGK